MRLRNFSYIKNAGITSIGGALLGGIGTYVTDSNASTSDIIKNSTIGGIAGASIGAGGTYAYNKLNTKPSYMQPNIVANTPTYTRKSISIDKPVESVSIDVKQPSTIEPTNNQSITTKPISPLKQAIQKFKTKAIELNAKAQMKILEIAENPNSGWGERFAHDTMNGGIDLQPAKNFIKGVKTNLDITPIKTAVHTGLAYAGDALHNVQSYAHNVDLNQVAQSVHHGIQNLQGVPLFKYMSDTVEFNKQ